jgi:RNA polymerase sporulation-specific sigma factor
MNTTQAPTRPGRYPTEPSFGPVRPKAGYDCDTDMVTSDRSPKVSERFLLARAQRGDRVAESLMIERYEWLVRRAASGFFLPNGEASDVTQVARIGLYDAIHCWDPTRRVRFRHFAAMVIRREIMMVVSASRTRNQNFVNTAFSLEETCAPQRTAHQLSLAELLAAPVRDANDPVEVTLGRERLRLILRGLPALSKHERGSLTMTLNGQSQQEISRELASNPKSINNALQRARRKLRADL